MHPKTLQFTAFFSINSRSLVSKLRGMTSPQNTENDYAAMLHAMCHWRKADHVLELVADWLRAGLKVGEDPDSSTSKRVCRLSIWPTNS